MTRYRWEVSHPDYYPVIVEAGEYAEAVREACEKWGVEWTAEAAQCSGRQLGRAEQPKCRRCGNPFGKKGESGSFCPACERVMARERLALQEIGRRADRRARAAEAEE